MSTRDGHGWTIAAARRAMESGTATSRALTEEALARIADPEGEGGRAFIRVFDEQARAAASAADTLRAGGIALSPLMGVPVSVKDLCDIKGITTLAGSVVLRDRAPADQDAPVIERLRKAGAVILGTTNMTEFALGGLGLNPHYGTPANPWDRATGRLPGGSSSGGAVSVTDGMAAVALGTDTAGSVRMPAALCGLAGFKPTARRVPRDGLVPLAHSLDSVGGLGRTVACCALFDAILAGEPATVPPAAEIAGLRFAVPKTLVLDDLEPPVAAAFERALSALSQAGARITEIAFAELGTLPHINRLGGLPIAEGYAWHRALLAEREAEYDPIIARRFTAGAAITAADHLAVLAARDSLIRRAAGTTEPFDAVLMPTVPMIAQPIADFDEDETLWLARNRLIIRNPAVANFLDRCALTIPCHRAGEAPVGLTLMGEAMSDRRILAIGRAVERLVAPVQADDDS